MEPQIPEAIKTKLTQNGIQSINEVKSLSALDLRDIFGFTPIEVCTIRRITASQSSRRPRDDDEESSSDDETGPKNGPGLLLAGLMEDPLGVRALLPSAWRGMTVHDLRASLLSGPLGRSENPHFAQEGEFLMSLVGAIKAEDPAALQLVVWSRMVQLILKSKYPALAAEVNACWNSAFPKVKDLSDLSLVGHVLRTQGLIETKMKQRAPKPTNPQAGNPPTQRTQFRFNRFQKR